VASLLVLAAVPVVWELTRPPTVAGSRPSAVAYVPPPPPSEPAGGAESPPAVGRRSGRISDLPPVVQIPPVRLRAERVGIDAAIAPVGVEAGSAAAMEIPEDPGLAGWYSYGPAPGDPAGVAVLTSHVDSARSGPGAFFRLRALDPGDRVIIDLSDGRVLEYEVTGREQMAKESLPTGDLFRRDGAPALALVTCGGAFDRGAGHYTDNVVVWAVPLAG
jgi:hypothetical protein